MLQFVFFLRAGIRLPRRPECLCADHYEVLVAEARLVVGPDPVVCTWSPPGFIPEDPLCVPVRHMPGPGFVSSPLFRPVAVRLLHLWHCGHGRNGGIVGRRWGKRRASGPCVGTISVGSPPVLHISPRQVNNNRQTLRVDGTYVRRSLWQLSRAMRMKIG